jgi:hypothetical protein
MGSMQCNVEFGYQLQAAPGCSVKGHVSERALCRAVRVAAAILWRAKTTLTTKLN